MNITKIMRVALATLMLLQPLTVDSSIVSGAKNLVGSAVSTVTDAVSGAVNTISGAASSAAQKLSEYKSTASDYYTSLKESVRSKVVTHEYSKKSATVRVSDDISSDEKNFVKKRLKVTRKALKKFLGVDLPEKLVPTIHLCFSGGGYRAMIETVGFLSGAQKVGLLDAATYMSGLSGSTWAITPWVLSGLSIDKYIPVLKKNINQKPSSLIVKGVKIPSLSEYYDIGKHMIKKYTYDQPLNFIDIYGALLGNMLFSDGIAEKHGKDKQTVGLTDMRKNIDDGKKYPLPILTALETTEAPTTKWFEFSPYESGSYHQGMSAYVPTWAFGREFKNGNSTTTAPEQSAAWMLAICGSAFAVDFWGVMHEAVKKLSFLPSPIYSVLSSAVYSTSLQQKVKDGKNYLRETDGRVATPIVKALSWSVRDAVGGRVPNYTYKMPNQRMHSKKEFTLVDGGHEIKEHPLGGYARGNLAAQPSLRPHRDIDLQIFCDSSANLTDCPSLGAAATRAKEDGHPFPDIKHSKYGKAEKNLITVFGENDANVPTVAYIPGRLPDHIKNFSGTLSFNYPPEQVDELSGLTRGYFIESASRLKQAIIKTVQAKAKKLGMPDPFATTKKVSQRAKKKTIAQKKAARSRMRQAKVQKAAHSKARVMARA